MEIKCVCGYVYEDANNCFDEIVAGDEPFIESKLFVSVPILDKFGEVASYKSEQVLICPKCGTLKIEV